MYDYRDLFEAIDRISTSDLGRIKQLASNPLADPNLTRSLAADLSATADLAASTAIADLAAVSKAATASIGAEMSATATSLRDKLTADYSALSEATREHVRAFDAQQQMLGTAFSDHFAASEAVLERIRALGEPALEVSSRLQDIYAEQHAVADAFRDQYLALDRYIERLPTFDWERLAGALGPIDELHRVTADLAAAYSEIDAGLKAEWSSIFALGVEGLPGIELYAHLNLLSGLATGAGSAAPEADAEAEEEEAQQEEIAEEGYATLHGLLAAHRPELVEPWLGGKEGLSARYDAVRKYCACQRLVLLELLTLAAPSSRVRAWSSNPEHFRNRDPKCEPTWRARILYLCDKASRADYGHFVLTDIRAAWSVYGLLNKGVHATRTGFTQRQVRDLQIRSDNLILMALMISIEAGR